MKYLERQLFSPLEVSVAIILRKAHYCKSLLQKKPIFQQLTVHGQQEEELKWLEPWVQLWWACKMSRYDRINLLIFSAFMTALLVTNISHHMSVNLLLELLWKNQGSIFSAVLLQIAVSTCPLLTDLNSFSLWQCFLSHFIIKFVTEHNVLVAAEKNFRSLILLGGKLDNYAMFLIMVKF